MREKKHTAFGRLSIIDDLAMGFLALVSALLLLVEFTTELSPSETALLDRADVTIAFVFLIEFTTRFLAAQKRKVFIQTYWWELFSCIPITSTVTQVFRALRIVRLVRLLDLARLLP